MSYQKLTPLLVLVICATGLVRAWDLGIVTAKQIEFFSDGTIDNTTDVQLIDMKAIAYDPIKKDVYVSDSSQKIGSIFRIKTIGNKAYNIAEPIVAKETAQVHGIAFDYITSTLYWTSSDDKTINYVSVSDEITVPLTGKILMKFSEEMPQGIAIDVHRGYLYWTNTYHLNPTIERSRLNGSSRQVLVQGNFNIPLGIAVDAESDTLYWSDELEGLIYSIQCMKLGDNAIRHTLVKGVHHSPYAIAVDDEYVYWSDWTADAVWKYPKYSTRSDASPTLVSKFKSLDSPMGLFALSNRKYKHIYTIKNSAGSKNVPLSFKIFSTLISVIITFYLCIN